MDKVAKFIKLRYWLIFTFFIFVYIGIVFSFVIIKYSNFGYNCMDLGIFNQVFFNSSNGSFYYFTIHPHSYLGDHFNPFLMLLLPIYMIFKSPLTLLFLQTLIIALCAIPIHLIAKHNLNKTWGLIIPILWLINPIAINMNFFEFHLLPFAMFFLLFCVYFYQKEKFGLFVLFTILSLSVREDVFLAVIMFSILALIQKRKFKWILWPTLVSLIYFPITQIIISKYNPEGRIKFVPFYNWLGGNNITEITKNYINHPIKVILHIFSLSNMVMIISLLISFLFIPLISPIFMILVLLIFLQYALTQLGGGDLIYQTHYGALFIPGLVGAYICSIKSIYNKNENNTKLKKILQKNKELITIYILSGSIFLLFLLSPIQIQNFEKVYYDKNVKNIKQEMVNYIPKNEVVASTYEFLPALSSRLKLYSLNYAYSGYKQLSYIPYELPKDTEYMIINFDDTLSYKIQYLQDGNYNYKNSYINWQNVWKNNNFSPIKIIDTYSLWKYDPNMEQTNKNNDYNFPLYKVIRDKINIGNARNVNINNEITFLGWDNIEITSINKFEKINAKIIPLALYFKKSNTEKIEKDYELQLRLSSKKVFRNKFEKIYPLTYGFYPTSKWKDDEIIKINYWFLVPDKLSNEDYNIEINLVDIEGDIVLDNQKSFIKKYSKKDILESTIKIELE
ncbi:MAG: DUF2079 domain-containing protein [Patescibacteria group bacterium]|nr:DUF2079 domain-containing protein [Patescibacteria group bacterium]MDD4303951.1 DUF2079 domain-containing protein [Patescibacteria group bacterium]MDD4695060.1 DUF2079 domain-containing protein [Patescibacteria group bacterium]